MIIEKSNLDFYKENGFLISSYFLSENEIDQIKKMISNFLPNKIDCFYYSLIGNSFKGNIQIKEILLPYFEKVCSQIFISDTQFITPSFLIKPKRTSETLLLHQDWSYVDERVEFSATVWISLIDTNENNGGLFVLPKSHLLFNNFRSGSLLTGRISFENSSFLKNHIKRIDLKKGQVFIFNPSLFHGSFPNNSLEDRIAITAIAMPSKTKLLHVVKDTNENIAKSYSISEDDFFKNLLNLSHANYDSLVQNEKDCFYYEHQNIDLELLTNKYKKLIEDLQ